MPDATVLASQVTQPATGVFTVTWLLFAIPLISAGVLLFGGRKTDRWGHWLGVAAPVASFCLGLAQVATLLTRPGGQRSVRQVAYNWIPVHSFQVDLGFQVDALSICFVLLITGVGSLIHVYSIGYMAHDTERRRFFGYLNLFIAAMLLLVLADNYLLMYAGWEGVGLASYLLIGFWYHKPVAATAGTKAFVMNRVGDVGMSIAVMLMFSTFGTVTFSGVFAGAGQASSAAVTAIGFLLLLGACAKSAQVPVQAWLFDAMEGPTPVSALIHAATMVTAGVYLIVRSAPIFNLAPSAQLAVTIVGVVTVIFGAVVGCAKDDIKRALAGSTISQIGYMVVAAGLGPIGYAFAIFHLLTHGFFKAGLFLGAGSIMHGMNDEVDMRKYGGLAKVMPWTFATFGVAYLAIIGIPPFSGFWSKDKIIEAAFDKGGASGLTLGTLMMIGAGITAYYMTRIMMMTFFGRRRWEADAHPHESPRVMVVPMVLLALGSAGLGVALWQGGILQQFLEPVVGATPSGEHNLSAVAVSLITLACVVIGGLIAGLQYGRVPVPRLAPLGNPFTVAARANLLGDAFNESVFMLPGRYLTRVLVFFDSRGIDGLVNGFAAFMGGASGRLRHLQTGFVRGYALSMFGGAVIVIAALLLVRVAG